MTEITNDHTTTAQKPSGVTPSTSTAPPQPTPQTLQLSPTRTSTIPTISLPTPTSDPNETRCSTSLSPAMPQPGAIPFLPQETSYTGTELSSRCSSVDPNDTLPPTPTPGPEAQPQPYPPQMRILPTRDTGKSTTTQQYNRHDEHESRPTTHLPPDDTHGAKDRAAAIASASISQTQTEHYSTLPLRPAQSHGVNSSYSAAKSITEAHPSGYRQNQGAIENPAYYGGQEQDGENRGEETLLGKLGKWVEGVNSKLVNTAIAGDMKGKRKE